MTSSKAALDDFAVKNKIPNDLVQAFCILNQKLENPSPISPNEAFSLSNKGLVSTTSVFITYIIILLQFKLSGS
jgi:hypothetical protein